MSNAIDVFRPVRFELNRELFPTILEAAVRALRDADVVAALARNGAFPDRDIELRVDLPVAYFVGGSAVLASYTTSQKAGASIGVPEAETDFAGRKRFLAFAATLNGQATGSVPIPFASGLSLSLAGAGNGSVRLV